MKESTTKNNEYFDMRRKEFVMNAWQRLAGVEESITSTDLRSLHKRNVTFESLRQSQWSNEFELMIRTYLGEGYESELDEVFELMHRKFILAYFRYHKPEQTSLINKSYDMRAALRRYLNNFVTKNNLDYLIDCINFCMLIFVNYEMSCACDYYLFANVIRTYFKTIISGNADDSKSDQESVKLELIKNLEYLLDEPKTDKYKLALYAAQLIDAYYYFKLIGYEFVTVDADADHHVNPDN